MKGLILVGFIALILTPAHPQLLSDLRMDEIADLYGYPNELHLFPAPDGFILSLFRINAREGMQEPGSRGPLLIMYGTNVDARILLHQGRDTSLPFVLANEGYDVWIVNPRATQTSRAHVDMSPDGNPETCIEADPYNNPCELGVLNTHQYFNLTYESYGDDVYEYYQYISSQTGSDAFPAFCGSNACSYLAAGMSMHADYFNNAVTIAVLFAPFIEKGNTVALLMRSIVAFLPLLSFIDNSLGFGLTLEPQAMTDLLEMVCTMFPALCDVEIAALEDANPTLIDPHLLLEFVSTRGAIDIPIRLMEHIGQNIRDKAFRRYDYGPAENLERYGSEEPPLFPLEDIHVPIALFFQEFDRMLTPNDREKITEEFGENVVYNEIHPSTYGALVYDLLPYRQEVMNDIVSVLENY